MKKIFIAFVFCLVSIMSYGQDWFNFDNNKNFEISFGVANVTPINHTAINLCGMNLTSTEFISELSYSDAPSSIKSAFGYTIDLSVWGIYLSLGCGSSLGTGASSSMSVDTHMDEGRCNIFHIGYKSPVTEWLYLYPIIGHVKMSTGYCNGSDYSINENGIHNHYTPVNTFINDFDFGGGIDIKIGHWFFISAKYTKYTKGIGLGFICDFNYLMNIL